MAYDAARKAAATLLACQELRPHGRRGTSRSPIAARAQFLGAPGLSSLDRLRRRRNQGEYPQPRSYDPIHPDEVDDGITAYEVKPHL